MNLELLRKKLLAAARASRPSDEVPYAFEKRVMANVSARPADVDSLALWNRVLWRAAAPCVGVGLSLAAWTFLASHRDGTAEMLVADLESAILAPFENLDDSW